jgi:hypothetical protein
MKFEPVRISIALLHSNMLKCAIPIGRNCVPDSILDLELSGFNSIEDSVSTKQGF